MSAPISVIIPTYQHGATIAACLESIRAQTLKPAEIIVVNDGSMDNTLDAIRPFADGIILLNQANHGGNAARNSGFAASRGERVIFCDADVVMLPDMLERLSRALDGDPEASYAYSGFRFGWKRFRSFPFDAPRLKRMNYIHTTSLIRRAHFPGFDPSIRRLQDWDVWLTILEQGRHGVFVDGELFRIIDRHGRTGISQWRPSFMYHMPWNALGWKPDSIRRFEEARNIVMEKHHLV